MRLLLVTSLDDTRLSAKSLKESVHHPLDVTTSTGDDLPRSLDRFDAVVISCSCDSDFAQLCLSQNKWLFAAGSASLSFARAAQSQLKRCMPKLVPQTWLEAARTGLASRSRFSHQAKMGESQTRTRPIQHPMLSHIPRTFVSDTTNTQWHIDPPVGALVLADDDHGPQIVAYRHKVWTMRAHLSSGISLQLLRNFLSAASADVLFNPDNESVSAFPKQRRRRPLLAFQQTTTERDRHEKLKRIARDLDIEIPPLNEHATASKEDCSSSPEEEEESQRQRPAESCCSGETSSHNNHRKKTTRPLVIRLKNKPQRPYCAHRTFQSNTGFYSVVNDGSRYLAPHEQNRHEEKINKSRWMSDRNFSTSGRSMSLRKAGGIANTGPFRSSFMMHRPEDKSKFITETGWRPIADRMLPRPPP